MGGPEHPTCGTAGAAIKQEDIWESKQGLSHPSKEFYVPLCLFTFSLNARCCFCCSLQEHINRAINISRQACLA